MWLTFAVKNRFYDEAVSQQTSLAEQKQEISMLKFCLQRDIKQCDAESVKKWNETHPGDTFTFHSVQELTEQAIRDVELYSAQRRSVSRQSSPVDGKIYSCTMNLHLS